jgi:hypothetical protein
MFHVYILQYHKIYHTKDECVYLPLCQCVVFSPVFSWFCICFVVGVSFIFQLPVVVYCVSRHCAQNLKISVALPCVKLRQNTFKKQTLNGTQIMETGGKFKSSQIKRNLSKKSQYCLYFPLSVTRQITNQATNQSWPVLWPIPMCNFTNWGWYWWPYLKQINT